MKPLNRIDDMQISDVYQIPRKKAVATAGQVLAGFSQQMSEEEALNILSAWRAVFSYPLPCLVPG